MPTKRAPQWTAPGTALLYYPLNPTLQSKFAAFYKKVIVPWLQARGVKGSAWIVGNTLFAVVSNNNPPWTGAAGIPKFDQFVEYQAPVVIKKLPDLL
ncbi:MAG TPA: hypothetical protein VNV88_10980 [Candidatus Solibacter sp.]|jgi:hypothetical protein|nr:hypothetical protein [Candidatus Solibacter sp.]